MSSAIRKMTWRSIFHLDKQLFVESFGLAMTSDKLRTCFFINMWSCDGRTQYYSGNHRECGTKDWAELSSAIKTSSDPHRVSECLGGNDICTRINWRHLAVTNCPPILDQPLLSLMDSLRTFFRPLKKLMEERWSWRRRSMCCIRRSSTWLASESARCKAGWTSSTPISTANASRWPRSGCRWKRRRGIWPKPRIRCWRLAMKLRSRQSSWAIFRRNWRTWRVKQIQ